MGSTFQDIFKVVTSAIDPHAPLRAGMLNALLPEVYSLLIPMSFLGIQ